MRCPIPDSLRRHTAEAQARAMLLDAAPQEAREHGADAPGRLRAWRGLYALDDWPRLGPPGRLRVGFLSFNFSPRRNLNGLVAGVCLALFGHHRADSAAERAAAEGHCTSWVDLQAGGQSDRVLARALNAQRPHVLVDLLGLIAHNRHGALLLRPAPVQLAMVYAATTGGPGADLLLGDAVATPPELAAQFSERLLLVPRSHFVNNQAGLLPAAWAPAARGDFALPARGALLAGMNAFFKISPGIFRAWAGILRGAPDATLLLAKYQYHSAAAANLRAAATKLGVAPERILFADKTESLVDHIRRLSLAAAFLDTHTYNAHTLAVDALWAGAPLVSLPGTALAQRVSASLLAAEGLGATLARTLDDYVAITEALVRSGGGGAERLRARFARVREGATGGGGVFDCAAFAARLKRALATSAEAAALAGSPSGGGGGGGLASAHLVVAGHSGRAMPVALGEGVPAL